MKTFFLVLCAMVIIAFLMVGCGVINIASWFADRAVVVAKQELDPVVLQQKYEWFKNAAAELDAKQAGLGTYKRKMTRLNTLEAAGKLDRTNREQLMLWEQEQQGLKFSYNELAGEYNSQMSKWNWRFTNVGSLPPGATVPLPREYKPYIEE